MIREKFTTLWHDVFTLYTGGLITALSVILKEGVPRAAITWLQVFTGVLLADQSGVAPAVLGELGWESAVAVANVSAIVALITSLRFLANGGHNAAQDNEGGKETKTQEESPTKDTVIVEDSLGYPQLFEPQPEERLPIETHEDAEVSNYTPEQALATYGRSHPEAKEG